MGVKKYKSVCDVCGKEFLIDSSTYHKLLDGRQKHSYCSKECKSNSQKTGWEITCDCCGKKFYRTKYQMNVNEKQNNFCAVECEFKFKHDSSMEQRVCEICHKTFACKKVSTQRFCSHDCQNKWQTTQVGELNPNYTRVKTTCDYCGKEFVVKQYRTNQEHIFCSRKCQQDYLKENVYYTDENRNFHRDVAISNLVNQKYETINSKPQQVVDAMLDELGISYQREYNIKYFCVDNYLSDSGLMIEVMGDYWHCNPTRFECAKNNIQSDNMRRDKAKHTYILNHYGIEPLYLWEYDIMNNPEMCKEMITEYICQNGSLQDFHSFNYKKDKRIPTQY